MGIITLGSSTISNIFATSTTPTTVSSSVVGLLSSSYSNGSTWPSTTGSAISVVNSPLISGSNGRWQFNGTDDYLNVTQSTLNATFDTSDDNVTQSFTFLFYGTIGSLTTRRALYGSSGFPSYAVGGDAILRTDTSPGAGKIHLDLRGPASQFNRFTITGVSGSLLNLGIAVSSSGVQSVYQDGVLVATSGGLSQGYSPWRSQTGTAGANIGYNDDTDTDNYNGQLGACYLYNRQLTATEISQSSLSFFRGTNLVTASLVYLGSTLVYTSSAAPAAATSVQTLVVAGGGSGGCGTGGGGGAGGVVYSGSLSLPIGTYAVNVGTGAAGTGSNNDKSPAGSKGQDSSFISGSIIVSASGGGGGVGYDQAFAASRNNGGSGGGQSDNNTTNGLTIDSMQGNNGGGGTSGTGCGGGGGGKGQAGFAPNTAYPNGRGGAGGSGSAYTIRSGTSVFYGGGGGGGTYAQAAAAGLGGPGGGGNGGGPTNNSNCTAGAANTGGGGGGTLRNIDGSNNGASGAGGSGIIVVAYLTSSAAGRTITGGIEETYTSASLVYKSHTFLSSSNLVIS
jgi:hypothetical protein